MKIRPVGTEFIRTDMTKLIVAFRNLANAPKMPGAIPPYPMHYLVTCLIDPRGGHPIPDMERGYPLL
jgi:hypothetical protein